MYKFLITIQLQPGTRDRILEAAAPVQKQTRAEPGCIAYDFFTYISTEGFLKEFGEDG